MSKSASEEKFEQYREHLRQEAQRLVGYMSLYRRLHERRADRLAEMNAAPAFFQVVIDALFSVIVLWVDKLFDEKGERGFFNFLAFVEHNRKILAVSELKRRKHYPDGHWMLNRKPIALETIEDHRKRIRDVKSLPSFRIRRDKFHAHFDKEYFFERTKLAEEAPLKWGDLAQIKELMSDILNTFSAAYDGKLYELEYMNINDVDHVLNGLHRRRKRRKG